MGLEIERKFLVSGDSFMAVSTFRIHIVQFYLNAEPDRTVRVRISGSRAWLTVKGITNGCRRGEWEYEIPVADAEAMRCMAVGRVVSKTRWIVPAGDGLKWEVDVFDGPLLGLRVAEIELPSEDTGFDRPAFVGREVTGIPAYYNSVLALGAEGDLPPLE